LLPQHKTRGASISIQGHGFKSFFLLLKIIISFIFPKYLLF